MKGCKIDMRKSIKRPESIRIDELFELLKEETQKYDIRENGAMEKKMALVQFKKELEKYLNTVVD